MKRPRRTEEVCICDAYTFPHRMGGGACGEPYEPEYDDRGDYERDRMIDKRLSEERDRKAGC